jgi:porin
LKNSLWCGVVIKISRKFYCLQLLAFAMSQISITMIFPVSPNWAETSSENASPSDANIIKISSDIEKSPESAKLPFQNQFPVSVTDLSNFSPQTKDLLVQNLDKSVVETPSNLPIQAESKEETKSPESKPTPDPYIGNLGGNWGGFRSDLAKSGVTFDLSSTQFLQGLVSGSGNKTFDFTGVVDLFVNVNTQKAGLWDGGSIHTHLIYAYGNSKLAGLGNSGAILPANTALFEPLLRGNAFEVSSLYLTQKLGDNATLIFGKLNVFDLVSSDPFLGGRGSDRFLNIALAAPPTGVTPPITFGVIAKIQTGDVGLTFMVFDPNDRWGKGLENLFSNGVGISAAVSLPMKMFGLSASHSFSIAYNTKTGTDLSDGQFLLPNPPSPVSQKTGAYNIAYQYNQFLYENPQNPKDRWGMFFKGAIADGNPNIISYSIQAGLGGAAPWRSQDSFGLGYFYYGFSGALKETFRPILTLGDEQGLEMYYKAALTPWLNLTGDLQIISPAIKSADTVYVLGFRLGIVF